MGKRRVIRALGLLAVLILASPRPAATHPLGNFSISQYGGIHIGDDAIALRYFIDMAEIPTFQELQTREIPADPAELRVSRYLRDAAESLKKGLVLEVDGQRLALDVRSAEVIFPLGVGVVAAARALGLTPAVVLLSTHPLGREHARELGAIFLPTPVKPKELVLVVERAVEKAIRSP